MVEPDIVVSTAWRVQRAWQHVVAFIRAWNRAQAPLNAAALAYYSIFSLPPALAIVVVAAARVLGPTATRGELAPRLTGLVPEEAARLLQEQISALDLAGAGFPTLALGALGLAWSGSRGLALMRTALDQLWGLTERRPGVRRAARRFLLARGAALGLLVASGFVVAALLSLEALISPVLYAFAPNMAARTEPLVDGTLTLSALALLLTMTYALLPTRLAPWRAAWPGALLATAIIALGRRLLGSALAFTGVATAFGAAASLIVLVMWFNFAAQAVLAGAYFGVALERRRDSKKLDRPVP